jgi:hypothetical protein
MDRMTDDIRMLAQLALSYIIPQAEFSEWLEEAAVNGYGHSLHWKLSQHNFDNNARLNSGEPSFPRKPYRTPPRAKRGGNDCPSESHHQPTVGNDYPSQSYQTPRPSPRKRSKNVTHSNPSPKNKSRDANNKDSLNMPDSIGGDSEGKTASSPLVRGSAKQSRDQDSQARDEGSSPARDEVGRYSTGNEEDAVERLDGSRKVLNLSSLLSGHGIDDRFCLVNAVCSILDGNIRRKVGASMRKNMPKRGDTPIKIADQALQPHGLYLRRVYQDYIDDTGGVVYNLLQLRECKMVLSCDLTRADKSGVAHHAIGWDGKAFSDDPYNIVVEEEDRSDKERARKVFDELFPKDTFDDWRIVQAFVLAKLSNKHKDDARRRRRNRARATKGARGAVSVLHSLPKPMVEESPHHQATDDSLARAWPWA